VPLFPPGTPVTVVLNGRPVTANVRAYLANGRVFAPVAPLLTRLADRIWFDGEALVIERDEHRVRVRVGAAFRSPLGDAYVPAGPALRSLGAFVRYDPTQRRLVVSIKQRDVVASPTPFNPRVPSVAPTMVFTPMPMSTPVPIWSGSPAPRRTALPYPPSRSLTHRE
jgi:hypothetical protein